MPSRSSSKPIAVFDFETDPFKFGRYPCPFAWGFYDGAMYKEYWQDTDPKIEYGERDYEQRIEAGMQCISTLVSFLRELDTQYIIYAHNGGKFDFMYLLQWLRKECTIINGRLVKCFLHEQELRDSYAIIPAPLAYFGLNAKKEINYDKMERPRREKHKREILAYMKQDCVSLWNGVQGFRDEFGDKLTMAGAAFGILRQTHDLEFFGRDRETAPVKDDELRAFYFGGRCQCFASGILHGEYSVYDVNSMYPYAMKTFNHPVSSEYTHGLRITERTAYAIIQATNYGCLPHKHQFGIDFTTCEGTFFASTHEINAGIDTGTLHIDHVIRTYDFPQWSDFGRFIDTYYSKRMQAKEDENELLSLFYKLTMNSSYGKLSMNPEDFKDYVFTTLDEHPGSGWNIQELGINYMLWSKPSERKSYYNIATGASITAASRAILLRGLESSDTPVYCDTDSIICSGFRGVVGKDLGQWKLEGSGDEIAIGGKKTYCLWDKGVPVKQASKGCRLTPEEIRKICLGYKIDHKMDVPAFKLDGKIQWIEREIKATAKQVAAFKTGEAHAR